MNAKRVTNLLLIGLALVVILSALPPRPVQAAAACATYHWVKKGDTTTSIAKTYGLYWSEVADANFLKMPYVLKEGTRLCIPEIREVKSTAKVASKGQISVMIIANRVYVTASSFREKGSYYVRVRDPQHKKDGWTKIGMFNIPEKTLTRGYFDLPAKFTSSEKLTLCIKNGTTDQVLCQTVPHW